MRQAEHVVQLGIETGSYGEPLNASQEITAIEVVMGGTEEGLEQLVGAAREACPNPNCCLSAVATTDSAEGGSWDPHPMNDTTYTVSFTRVDVSCSKNASGCGDRVARLTDGIASMAQTCIEGMGDADAAGKEKTNAAAKEAKRVTSTASVKKAEETIKAAQERAAEIKSGGETEATEARDAIYAQARAEIVASFVEVGA